MDRYRTADARLLEDQHRLRKHGLDVSREVVRDLPNALVLERDGAEVGIERMQRVADLVHGLLLGPREFAVDERVRFEEVTDLVAAVEEVAARSVWAGGLDVLVADVLAGLAIGRLELGLRASAGPERARLTIGWPSSDISESSVRARAIRRAVSVGARNWGTTRKPSRSNWASWAAERTGGIAGRVGRRGAS